MLTEKLHDGGRIGCVVLRPTLWASMQQPHPPWSYACEEGKQDRLTPGSVPNEFVHIRFSDGGSVLLLFVDYE